MIQDFFSRFHPLLVHLPIGIFLLGALLKAFSLFKNNTEEYHEALKFIRKASFFTALFAASTGYLLSLSGEFSSQTLDQHQWSGIIFTILTGVFAFVKINNRKLENTTWIILSILLSVVGHLGGSLTHGEDYLSFSKKVISDKLQIADIQKAKVYEELVRPIIESKCYACHAASKQKGELRLDTQLAILKGGKNGACLKPGNAAQSEMIKRMLLPMGDEEHMPPKGKPQLTENEIAVLKWWINEKAPFEKNISQMQQNSEMKIVLASFQTPATSKAAINLLPSDKGADIDQAKLSKFEEVGIVILPIANESNYLSVNILNKTLSDDVWKNLEQLAENILFFKSNKANFSKNGWMTLAKMKNLRSLNLNNSNIQNKELGMLSTLTGLRILNISGTMIDAKGMSNLKAFINLEKVFIFETKIEKSEFVKLKAILPNVKIDTGGYVVPTLLTDTTFNTF
jgi:uncharacterized membrane protein